MQCFRQRREELMSPLSVWALSWCASWLFASAGRHEPSALLYLRLAGIPLVTRDSNFIEEAVELVDNGRHLLGKISSVHGDLLPAAYQTVSRITMQ